MKDEQLHLFFANGMTVERVFRIICDEARIADERAAEACRRST